MYKNLKCLKHSEIYCLCMNIRDDKIKCKSQFPIYSDYLMSKIGLSLHAHHISFNVF